MEGNHFGGPLPVSLVHASNLQALELRDNAFTGVVPSYWSLPSLTQLDLGANNLETDQYRIPFGNLSSNLQQLFLTENNFSGSIPSEIGNLGNLTVLQLEGNRFSGRIPETLGNLGRLFVFSLANNILSGRIPESIGNLESLSELYLQENNLSGSIPPGIKGCKNLVMLNLSHNVLQGSIPPEILSISSLSKGLDLSYNKLTGSISSNIGRLINLGFLDISNNHLSGVIPHTLGDCILLESIHLEVNFFYGSIPLSFSSLRGITKMDLSQNNLSGEIPNFLETFSSLQLLNLSFNNLDGVVPTGGPFSNSSRVFLEGNKMLCTRDPILQLPHCMSTISNRKRTSYIILIAVPLVSAVTILAAFAAIILLKKRFRKKKLVQKSLGLKKFSYSDVAKATNEFSLDNLVGAGRFGFVYIGIFKFLAHPVAVKVFKLDQLGEPKNFFTECEVLRSTRHRNLIRVFTLCSCSDQVGNEFKALIFEYMGNGNLEIWLHSNGLSETKRMLSLVENRPFIRG
ncbi:probable LRR receptor-like serine/threonine-protein kinase At3g47570 [Miscanthus floridulus]|uniref:probable LRR receptor-like serine/threonine-protein kinase At3g47570 n=1 Tax=Miscanthus floridulus TaxID=154761 RepID=UPI00345A0E7C